jgi:hypothetical protein
LFKSLSAETCFFGASDLSCEFFLLEDDKAIVTASLVHSIDRDDDVIVIRAERVETSQTGTLDFVSSSNDIRGKTAGIGTSVLFEDFLELIGLLGVVIHIAIEVFIGLNHAAFVRIKEERVAHSDGGVIPVAAHLAVLLAEHLLVLLGVARFEPVATHAFSGLEIFKVFLFDSVPSRVTQERETESGEDLVLDGGGSHDFVEEDSTFEMGTGRSGIAVIFQREDGNRLALVIVACEGQKFRGLEAHGLIADTVGVGSEDLGFSVGAASGVDEGFVESWGESHDVEDFVKGHFGKSNEIGVFCFHVGQIEVDLSSDRAVVAGVDEAGGGPGDITLVGFVLGGGEQDDVGFDVVRDFGDSDFSALLAGNLTEGEIQTVDLESGFVEHFGGGNDLIDQEIVFGFSAGLSLEVRGVEMDSDGTSFVLVVGDLFIASEKVDQKRIFLFRIDFLRGVFGSDIFVNTLMLHAVGIHCHKSVNNVYDGLHTIFIVYNLLAYL